VRGFAKFTGLTPHAYIVQRRLDAARAMIAAGATLANAAVACGFADQSHFNRTFIARYGVTPGTYAEAVR
jgi:AraC-like DNA-binding protein